MLLAAVLRQRAKGEHEVIEMNTPLLMLLLLTCLPHILTCLTIFFTTTEETNTFESRAPLEDHWRKRQADQPTPLSRLQMAADIAERLLNEER